MIRNLKILKYLTTKNNEIVKNQDFTTILTSSADDVYNVDRRTKRIYHLPGKPDDIAVIKHYYDVYSTRTVHGIEYQNELTAIKIRIEWLNLDDSIGLIKEQIAVELRASDAEAIFKKRRIRAIDYLKGIARNTAADVYIKILFTHYLDAINTYREMGGHEFRAAINAETKPNILGILGTKFPHGPSSVLTTVKNIILSKIH